MVLGYPTCVTTARSGQTAPILCADFQVNSRNLTEPEPSLWARRQPLDHDVLCARSGRLLIGALRILERYPAIPVGFGAASWRYAGRSLAVNRIGDCS